MWQPQCAMKRDGQELWPPSCTLTQQMHAWSPPASQAKWQAIFALCDDDGNGRLTAPELAHKLSDLGLPLGDDGARAPAVAGRASGRSMRCPCAAALQRHACWPLEPLRRAVPLPHWRRAGRAVPRGRRRR